MPKSGGEIGSPGLAEALRKLRDGKPIPAYAELIGLPITAAMYSKYEQRSSAPWRSIKAIAKYHGISHDALAEGQIEPVDKASSQNSEAEPPIHPANVNVTSTGKDSSGSTTDGEDGGMNSVKARLALRLLLTLPDDVAFDLIDEWTRQSDARKKVPTTPQAGASS